MMLRLMGSLAGSLALFASLAACSSDDGASPPSGGSSSGGSSSGGTSSAGAPSGGSASGGTSSGGTASGSAGAGALGGGGSASTAGASGTAGAAGNGGSAGSSGGTTGGGGGASGGSAGGGAGVACPADKTFCSGFEEATLPAGAVYKVNAAPGEWTRDFEVDMTVFKSGKSSLKLKNPSGSGSGYQMLAVPAPSGGKFWARFYIRQADADIGIVDHNVFAGASDTDEPNSTVMVEFAEDVGVSFNTSDDVRWPTGFGRINGATMPFTLAKGQWHCIELSYDGVARAQKLYVNGELKIDATDYPKTLTKPLTFFKFGFNKLHGPAREIWYDDVAVGPTRPGCL